MELSQKGVVWGRRSEHKAILVWFQELKCLFNLLQALKWELCPVTIVSWLNLYLQVDALKDVPKVLLPQYSQEKFIQIAQVSSQQQISESRDTRDTWMLLIKLRLFCPLEILLQNAVLWGQQAVEAALEGAQQEPVWPVNCFPCVPCNSVSVCLGQKVA